MEQYAFAIVIGIVVIPVNQGAGVPEASCMAYMLSVPVTSTSQALGSMFSLIILMLVHTLQP